MTGQDEALMTDPHALPADLPAPQDDGAADHLPGTAMPPVSLTDTDGTVVDLAEPRAGRTVLYFYPLTARPGADLPDDWDAIPGARGCTAQACDLRDHFADLRSAGVEHVWGVSSQTTDYQAEAVRRLRLPFTMLSDPSFAMGAALNLPTFSAGADTRLYSRLTLVVSRSRIEHVFYPIFPPNAHAHQVLDWLQLHPQPAGR